MVLKEKKEWGGLMLYIAVSCFSNNIGFINLMSDKEY